MLPLEHLSEDPVDTADINVTFEGITCEEPAVEQENENEQLGFADAYAESGEVSVWNRGDIFAGGDGISADSTAVAVADVDQDADQATRTAKRQMQEIIQTSPSSRRQPSPLLMSPSTGAVGNSQHQSHLIGAF